MGYNHGDSFPVGFEPNGVPFGSKSKRNLLPGLYPIKCERKWKYSFLSVKRQLDRKTITDRLITVRETDVSRHQGA